MRIGKKNHGKESVFISLSMQTYNWFILILEQNMTCKCSLVSGFMRLMLETWFRSAEIDANRWELILCFNKYKNSTWTLDWRVLMILWVALVLWLFAVIDQQFYSCDLPVRGLSLLWLAGTEKLNSAVIGRVTQEQLPL